MKYIKNFVGILVTSVVVLGILFVGVYFFNNRGIDGGLKYTATPSVVSTPCDNSKDVATTTPDSGACPIKRPNNL